MYNKVTYPNEITRRGPTWPLAFNLWNTMYVSHVDIKYVFNNINVV